MRSLFAATALAVVLVTPALAQDADHRSGAEEVYEVSFFERFSPRTALDMVQQVPGFSIEGGNQGQERGLGQASENVLINGRRISGKSNNVRSALGRIPASAVQRIELYDGATLGIPGLSGQVVNVVADLASFGGNWTWNPEFREGVDPNLGRGSISINGSRGNLDYTLSFENNSWRNGSRGPEIVFEPDGTILDTRTEHGQLYSDSPVFSGALSYETNGGTIWNLNAQYGLFDFDGGERSYRTGPGMPDRAFFFSNTEQEWNAELGGDVDFELGPGRLKLIALQRLEDSPTVSQNRTHYADGRPAEGGRFSRQADEGESIFRSEYSIIPREGYDWQWSLEGAYNFLDIESDFETLNPDGSFTEIALPNASSRVEERRAETNLTHSRPINSVFSAQASIGVEYSELTQDGAAGLTREFVRPKGFVSLTYHPNDNHDVRFRLERRVGQISFFSFIASVDLNNGNANAGNPELVPPQFWRAELEGTRRFGELGTVTTSFYYERAEDIIDIIPIGATGQSVGNLEEATLYGVEVQGTLNLDSFGIGGGQINFRGRLDESELEDPLTGETRELGGRGKNMVHMSFRQDIPDTDWAWGTSYSRSRNSPNYRLDEVSQFEFGPQFFSAFVEHKDVMGATVNVGVRNIFREASERFERTVYQDRRDGPVAFTELRGRKFGPILALSISREF